MPVKIREQTANILNCINQNVIDIQKLSEIVSQGIPDEIRGIRPIVWQVLLNHFPLETSKWDE